LDGKFIPNHEEMKGMLMFAASLAAFSGVSQEETLNKMVRALQMGSISGIEAELSSEVDFTLESFEDFCSKKQVSEKLSGFFTNNKSESFSIKHDGASRGNGLFKIGELITSNGTYRVTIYIEKEGSQFKVSQLKIE